LYVAGLKLALKLARTKVDKRPKVRIVIKRAGNAVLFERGF